jgi:hypothetical protein
VKASAVLQIAAGLALLAAAGFGVVMGVPPFGVAGLCIGGVGLLGSGALTWWFSQWFSQVMPVKLRAPTPDQTLATMRVGAAMAARATLAARLRATEAPVSMLVVRATASGELWGAAPVYEIEWEGDLSNQRGVRTTALEPVPIPERPKLLEGRRLRVLVDPDDPQQVVVDW